MAMRHRFAVQVAARHHPPFWLSNSFDQPLWQPQPRPQQPLPPRHSARVGLVIVTGQVQQPMQHQHLDLHRKHAPVQRPAAAPSAR